MRGQAVRQHSAIPASVKKVEYSFRFLIVYKNQILRMTSVNSNNNYYEDVDTEDSAPMLHAGKGRRNRATSSSSRGCFEYLQLTIQLGIFLALVYLGLILTETKNQVNSFANDQNA